MSKAAGVQPPNGLMKRTTDWRITMRNAEIIAEVADIYNIAAAARQLRIECLLSNPSFVLAHWPRHEHVARASASPMETAMWRAAELIETVGGVQ